MVTRQELRENLSKDAGVIEDAARDRVRRLKARASNRINRGAVREAATEATERSKAAVKRGVSSVRADDRVEPERDRGREFFRRAESFAEMNAPVDASLEPMGHERGPSLLAMAGGNGDMRVDELAYADRGRTDKEKMGVGGLSFSEDGIENLAFGGED